MSRLGEEVSVMELKREHQAVSGRTDRRDIRLLYIVHDLIGRDHVGEWFIFIDHADHATQPPVLDYPATRHPYG